MPIIPDEARTFGMDSLFPTAKIYSPHGQNYTPVDLDLFLSYKEATNGQILHEGINEVGSVASFTAAGSSYATHGEPMIPLYIFYSMFGFQRTADGLWAAADQMARGFLLGATAGRTTLNGEGLQHEDGQSHLIAATNPAVVAYDPAYAFETAYIVEDGLRRMYGDDPENVFYYLTLYNEPMVQPAEPAGGVDVPGLLKGLYRYAPAPTVDRHGAEGDAPDGPAARVRCRAALGAQGPAAARERLGGGGRRVVGDVVDRAAAGRGRVRGAQPPAPGRRAEGPVRDVGAGRHQRPGGRGVGLHAGGSGPDLAVGAD